MPLPVSKAWDVGLIVWVKYSSYPWWPARVCDENGVEDSVLRLKEDDHVLVLFLGSPAYAWVEIANIRSFAQHFKLMSTKCSSEKEGKAAVMEAVRMVAALNVKSNVPEFARNFNRYILTHFPRTTEVSHEEEGTVEVS